MKQEKLYIVASHIDGIDLNIETFHTPDKCVRYIGELVTDEHWDFYKPDPSTDPEEYLNDFYEYVAEENDNETMTNVALKIEEL